MEDSNLSDIAYDDENHFVEAFDEFPYYDCADSDEINQSVSHSSSISELQAVAESNADLDLPKSKLRRRRTFSHHGRKDISDSGNDSKDSDSVSFRFNGLSIAESARKFRYLRKLKENEGQCESSGSKDAQFGSGRNNDCSKEDTDDNSVVIDANDVKPNQSIETRKAKNSPKGVTESSVLTDADSESTDKSNADDSQVGVVEESSSHFLFSLAALVVKAIGFQVKLLVSLVTFPTWLVYSTYTFVVDPFHVTRRCREYFTSKLLSLWGAIFGRVSQVVYEWFKEHKSIWKMGMRFGWGMLWSIYVCFVLVSFLISAFVISGLVLRVLIDEPIELTETLNFDYTKHNPVAFVPIISCPDVSCGMNCREKIDTEKLGVSRIIPSNHKLQVTVSLTLPESDHNRDLGIFQVRVDCLSPNGDALSSSRHHSMLHFRSQPVRLLSTFLKIAPLLAGFHSEAQILNIKFRGLTERDIPAACLRVIIEQRAEFQPGAGVPEIYDATLRLQSEQPLLKRILWYWKRTIFVWFSMTVFTMELLFGLLCCKPFILPKATPRGGSTNRSSFQNGNPVQW